eukprot:TRINITY_DN15750_c0_g1_i1.p1 TRINITY_DN15750_c0_g1~~TRINITY_DN15750_c0_g1_i1.p1  ORF type:complete len:767 (+),score=156.02 TRINITY_DN15750_c0_g1_i1:96-2396(+)
MGDEDDDVAAALAFLRKHDASKTGAPVASTDLANLGNIDLDDPDALEEALRDDRRAGHEPVGPNWKKPGNFAVLPNIKGHPDSAWLMHERQVATGKYRAWLFFSTKNGTYYRLDDLNDPKSGYTLMSTPHNPWLSPLNVRVGSACLTVPGVNVKSDMAVLLPDLPRTSFLLKQPLEFLDKPASLVVLCAGVRNTGLASEFCAKRLHTLLLPKLSSKATVWYDYELVKILEDTAAELENMLLDSPACFAGCSLAFALLAGTRLCVASLGNVRCLLCRPGFVANAKNASASAWTAKDACGGGSTKKAGTNTGDVPNAASGAPESAFIFGGSARSDELEAVSDEWERERLRTSRSTNSFAALGLSTADLREGFAGVRRHFRRRSLLVHPDKVTEARRKSTGAIFARLEAAADAVEAMLRADMAATQRLCDLHSMYDAGTLATAPAVAAKCLGVAEGCGREKASAASKKLKEGFEKLQHTSRDDVERALFILDVAVDCVAKDSKAWNPPSKDLGVTTRSVLGCKDLKAPKPLVNSKLNVEIHQLGLSEPAALVLITDGAEALLDSQIAVRCSEHAPGRPRAAALRIALDARSAASQVTATSTQRAAAAPPVSAVCAMFAGDGCEPWAASAASGAPPPAKRARSANPKPQAVRVSHILLRWVGLKVQDGFERPNWRPPTRSQADAERTLLELMERLLKADDPKTLGRRFKAEILRLSECSTALNVPHADLGWMEPGDAEPPLEVAAFDLPIGGLSDVVVTSRGAHLMYRLA